MNELSMDRKVIFAVFLQEGETFDTEHQTFEFDNGEIVHGLYSDEWILAIIRNIWPGKPNLIPEAYGTQQHRSKVAAIIRKIITDRGFTLKSQLLAFDVGKIARKWRLHLIKANSMAKQKEEEGKTGKRKGPPSKKGEAKKTKSYSD
jgi:hypothetical protein